MDEGAVFTATALASALGCILMGVLAKYPIATAPALGINAFSFLFSLYRDGCALANGTSRCFVASLILLQSRFLNFVK